MSEFIQKLLSCEEPIEPNRAMSLTGAKCILREKNLAIYFGDSQFRRNRIFNFIISKIYVDKRLGVR